MKRAHFIAPARREFLAEVAYYSGQEPGLGARFAAAVEEATARAVAFPFAVVYRSDENGIVIFALAHHARRPEYWQSRVQER